MDKEKISKILLHGMHDHTSGVTQIEALIRFIKEDKSKNVLTDDSLNDYLDKILRARSKIIDSIDYIYSELKKNIE